jgi:hypothetical protein
MENFLTPEPVENWQAPEFVPVPMARNRHDGWTEARQRQFLRALMATGTVGAAARMVGMSRKSAYQLRTRTGAESFARAWDGAIETGRARIFDYQMERAFNGTTTITLRLGGAVEIGHGLDGRLVASSFKAPPPGENRFGGNAHPKGDIR